MDKYFEDFLHQLNDIEVFLDDDKNQGIFLNALHADFKSQVEKLTKNSKEILEENRNICVGIVGQMKAGKSSFINSLLFEGKDILPQAATPMTASLTKIIYSENPYAKIFYYSDEDWSVIRQNASEFDRKFDELWKKYLKNREDERKSALKLQRPIAELSEEQKRRKKREIMDTIPQIYSSCKELIEMAEKNGMEGSVPFGQVKEIEINDIDTDLKEYVGSGGRFTPFVKYIVLGINNDKLKDGVEIVDTPGMNDPIASREMKTRDFLINCDLVFILSSSSQFLTKDDIELIQRILPGDNIAHAILLGTKFDYAMLDDNGRDGNEFNTIMKKTVLKLCDRAQSNIKQALNMNPNSRILERLSSSKPSFVASILYNAAVKKENGEPLSDNENHTINSMVKKFAGMRDDVAFLKELSNIVETREKQFKYIREKKNEIMEERRAELFDSQYNTFLEMLNNIQADAENNLCNLKNGDANSPDKKLANTEKAIVSMRNNVSNIFKTHSNNTVRFMTKMAADVKGFSLKFQELNVRERVEKIHHVIEHWFSPDEHWDEVITHKVAAINDVIDNISKYINESESYVINQMNLAIDIEGVKSEIKKTTVSAFQKADTEFDENDILGPVSAILGELTLPPFQLIDDREKYFSHIISKFPSSQVEDEDIYTLQVEQTRIMQRIQQDINDKIEEKTKNIKSMMDEKASTFSDDIKSNMEEKIDILKSNIKNKEENIKRYEGFLSSLNNKKTNLRKIKKNI